MRQEISFNNLRGHPYHGRSRWFLVFTKGKVEIKRKREGSPVPPNLDLPVPVVLVGVRNALVIEPTGTLQYYCADSREGDASLNLLEAYANYKNLGLRAFASLVHPFEHIIIDPTIEDLLKKTRLSIEDILTHNDTTYATNLVKLLKTISSPSEETSTKAEETPTETKKSTSAPVPPASPVDTKVGNRDVWVEQTTIKASVVVTDDPPQGYWSAPPQAHAKEYDSPDKANWRTQPMTPRQKAQLQRQNISFEDNWTKGQASDAIQHALNTAPATEKQKNHLKALGLETLPAGLTKKEATELIDKERKAKNLPTSNKPTRRQQKRYKKHTTYS